jgi:type III secretion protein L
LFKKNTTADADMHDSGIPSPLPLDMRNPMSATEVAQMHNAVVSMELERLKEEYEHRIDLMCAALETISQTNAVLTDSLTRQVADMGLELAGHLARGAIETDPERVMSIVAEAVKTLGERHSVRIRVHSTVFNALRERGADKTLAASAAAELLPDDSVDSAGCIVESTGRKVDAQLRSLLAQARRLFDDQDETH